LGLEEKRRQVKEALAPLCSSNSTNLITTLSTQNRKYIAENTKLRLTNAHLQEKADGKAEDVEFLKDQLTTQTTNQENSRMRDHQLKMAKQLVKFVTKVG